MSALTIDFFHDVVCCWCFNISSRMRGLSDEFDLNIRHRTFVLQAMGPGSMNLGSSSPFLAVPNWRKPFPNARITAIGGVLPLRGTRRLTSTASSRPHWLPSSFVSGCTVLSTAM